GLSAREALGCYYSGYPEWKLSEADGVRVRSHAWRTLVTYGLHSKVPERFRPSNRSLFRWQDDGFDRWVGKVLESADFHHGIPGQCLRAFRRARELGVPTVLNHATGPVTQLAEILQPEYDRIGKKVSRDGGFGQGYLDRVAAEWELSDYHCCASSIVKEQLVAEGVEASRIGVVGYGADPSVWNRDTSAGKGPVRGDAPFRILFAGQLSLRKGIRFLLEALEAAGKKDWKLDCFGPVSEETAMDREGYQGQIPVQYHGPCSQERLAQEMHRSDVLVLPSLEEGFGLVVVQALACGLPCLVSDRVGAKDLIRHRQNGSVVPVGDSEALFEELQWWQGARREFSGCFDWTQPVEKFLTLHEEWKGKPVG
ncbi:MAG: glycosyltransferase family 4 protein, partial [Verrucomicrobiales bacterium]